MTELFEAARAYIGTPFCHKGRKRSRLDCVGLGVRAARDIGWPVQDLSDYAKNPHGGLLEKHLEANLGPPVARGKISREMLQPNDLVAMRLSPRGPVRHVGIIAPYLHGGLSLIHTAGDIGKVVEHRLDDETLARFAAVYRRVG